MKKMLLTILLTPFFAATAFSQTKDITGTVTNEKNEAITGASVKVKSTTQSAFTDDNGTFSLTGVPDSAILVVSAKGYQEQEVPIQDKSTVTVILVKAAAPAVQGAIAADLNRSFLHAAPLILF